MAEALCERNQSPMAGYERAECNPAVAQVLSMLAEAKFNSLWAAGQSLTIEEAIQLALSDRPRKDFIG